MFVCVHCKEKIKTKTAFKSHLTSQHKIKAPNVDKHAFINNFGQENSECLTAEFLISCIEMGLEEAVPLYIKKIYVNDDFPENKTVIINDPDEGYALVRTDGEYIKCELKETMDTIMNIAIGVLRASARSMRALIHTDGIIEQDDLMLIALGKEKLEEMVAM
jgi:hypothetical protein